MVKSMGRRGVSRAQAQRDAQKLEAKAAETKVRSVGEPGLPLPKQADILEAINDIKGWNAKCETANAKRRLAFKAWKAKHVAPELVRKLIDLERNEPETFKQYIESLAIGLKAIHHQVQISVFDVTYGSDIEEAKAKATQAAKAGKSAECRFPEGSEAHTAYMDTYAKVQARMAPGAGKLGQTELDDAIAAGKASAAERQPELTH